MQVSGKGRAQSQKNQKKSEKVLWLGLIAQNGRWSQEAEALGEINMKSSPLLQEQVNSLPPQGARSTILRTGRAAGAGELWPRPRGEGGLDHSEQVQSQRSYYQHGAPCQDDKGERQGSLATQHPRSFLTKVTLGSTDRAVQGSQGPRLCFPICLGAQIFSVTLATVVRSWAASRLQAPAH